VHTVPAGEFRYGAPPTKGSRFVTTLAPATTPEEAEAFVERMRAEEPDASHHCWAWRVGKPCDRFRSSDDGEPSGSAGRPILLQLEGHEVTDVVCVVTRWFGGTKLGVGGLMRAYGGCAGQALDRAPTREVVETARLRVTCPYSDTGTLDGFLAHHALTPVSSDYGESIVLELDVPSDEVEALTNELRDRTAGRAAIE
jgi:uncharacterized YigZ family protein